MQMTPPKITFVAIIAKQVDRAETIDAEDIGAITRRLGKFNNEGDVHALRVVYGSGNTYLLHLPLSGENLSRWAERLYRETQESAI